MNKALYILFFFFLIQNPIQSQNLIYNGDFEIYDTCPNSTSQLNFCSGWTTPTLGTSDYFNLCGNYPISVPFNFAGFQYPKSGNGYIGFFPFWDLVPCEYREYIQSKLISPLISGKKYSLTYYISLSFPQSAIERIGALFSVNPIIRNDDCPILASPQIINQNGFIVDTLDWVKIEGEFIAQGGEEYITLGYFEDTSNIFVLPILPDSITLGYFNPYYYIDDMSLIETNSEIIIPNIFSPNRDEVNEIFKIENAYGKTEMKIFNRWGELVYFAEGRNCYWDGRTYAGVECPDGVYYYSIKIEEIEFKGFVHLVR